MINQNIANMLQMDVCNPGYLVKVPFQKVFIYIFVYPLPTFFCVLHNGGSSIELLHIKEGYTIFQSVIKKQSGAPMSTKTGFTCCYGSPCLY